jgi:hypothetical protein
MEPAFVVFVMVTGILLVISLQAIIIAKKKIHYKYNDTSKKLTSFDYWTDYDGNWIFKDIGLNQLLLQNPEDKELHKMAIKVKALQYICGTILAVLFIGGAILKIAGVL